eukprot:scaffold4504_cov116-Isochrysis_galbana.AAC.16
MRPAVLFIGKNACDVIVRVEIQLAHAAEGIAQEPLVSSGPTLAILRVQDEVNQLQGVQAHASKAPATILKSPGLRLGRDQRPPVQQCFHGAERISTGLVVSLLAASLYPSPTGTSICGRHEHCHVKYCRGPVKTPLSLC